MRFFLALVLLPVIAWSNWTPVDFQKWRSGSDSRKYQAVMGRAVQNYQKPDSSWTEIQNDWITVGDTLHTVHNCLLKTDVNDKGQSTVSLKYGGNIYTLSQRPIKLIWINTQTHNWTDIFDSVTWSIPTVNGNLIKWTNVFPAVDYRIRKQNGTVQHGIFFKKKFLDSAVTLYNQRSDSQYIALGNVMAYVLSSNIDNAESAIGNVNKRRLKDLGKIAFELTEQRVHFSGVSDSLIESDSSWARLAQLPVKQRWIKAGNKIYCVEFVMMRDLKKINEEAPNSTIWHNSSPTTITGTTDLEDNAVFYDNWSNYGALSYMKFDSLYGHAFIRCKNVSTALGAGATITACTLAVYDSLYYDTCNVSAYRLLKPWVESTSDAREWNDDGAPADHYWGDTTYWNSGTWLGPQCRRDDGSDNSTNGGYCATAASADAKATVESPFVHIDAAGQYYKWGISNALAQGWYDGTMNEEGVTLIGHNSSSSNKYASSEHANANIRPYYIFYYTTGEEAAPARRRRIIEALGGK